MGILRSRMGRLLENLPGWRREPSPSPTRSDEAPSGSTGTVREEGAPPASPEDSLRLLEERLGWSFRNPEWLREALTHRSYVNEHPGEGVRDNERLEFLGDAVLQLVVSAELFRRFPDWPEGRLTALRTALIRGEQLTAWAEALELGRFLRLGKGEAEGSRTRPSILADAFEALLGALYLDGGLAAAKALLRRLLPEAIAQALENLERHDPKGRLQQWSQAVRGQTPVYEVVAVEGPPHAARFTVRVRIGEEVVGEGQGTSKREATREAARDALRRLGLEDA
jgi:ribonuclease-3